LGGEILTTESDVIRCPVCGGEVLIESADKVSHCGYCASPVLGPSQNRDCVNHPGTLAKEVCNVCGDLLCEECIEKRVGDYGGKLLTIINCTKPSCVSASAWANPINEEYQRLANFDWADKSDNIILRITGGGAVIMMIFELFFILGMLYMQYFTSWGSLFPIWTVVGVTIPGLPVIVLMILGNLLGALLLQTSLQVFIHERQFTSGILLLFLLILESSFLLWRGLYFNLRTLPDPTFLLILLSAFILGAFLILVGSLGAIYIGNKKRIQIKRAKDKLGLSG
jgi:hypothetical protein